MAFSLQSVFTTKTALPPRLYGYREAEPCASLKPYVRCFWQLDGNSDVLRIIPDCCADIIISDTDASFCGISTRSFMSRNAERIFGIRFYIWGVSAFFDGGLQGTHNSFAPADALFVGATDMAREVQNAAGFAERVATAQRYLLSLLRADGYDADVMNAFFSIIRGRGRTPLCELSKSLAVSDRTLERKFTRCTGVSPKRAVDLVRYQLLWQACMRGGFSVQDSVCELGYYDASHLYRDFEKFHGVSLADARREYLSDFYNTNRVE